MSQTEHEMAGKSEYKYGMRIDCTCGAHWSMKPTATDEEIKSIFDSHVAYAKRIATRVD